MMLDLAPWPFYADDEVAAVERVLRSGKVNYWTGEEGRLFEKEFADFCGARYAVAVANGTLALELALIALGIGEGDEVVVTARTFFASASAIVRVGARPVFADVDPESQNITPETVAAVLSDRSKAIIAVHLAGWPCEMNGIMALADQHGLFVVEDCAQAHGALYHGRSVGSLGHVAAWSFCQDKIMSTGGEGGMLTTNSAEIWERAWSFKDHGKSWDAVYKRRHREGFRWLHESFGSNWRMTEMQAAIGRCQIGKMPDWHEKRVQNAQALYGVGVDHSTVVEVPQIPDAIEHAWYKFYLMVRVAGLADGWDRDRILTRLGELGVPSYSGSCPEVYLEKAFEGGSYRFERLPVARDLGERSLMFLVHPTLTDKDMEQMLIRIDQVLKEASK